MITIKLNEKEYQYPEESSVQSILENLNISENGIAIAINQSVISKDNWPTTKLNNNDNVLVIKAVQGG